MPDDTQASAQATPSAAMDPVTAPVPAKAFKGQAAIAPRVQADSTRLERVVTAVVSAVVAVSALGTCIATLALSTKAPWTQFAFEPIVLLACVLGFLFASGKFRWAPAMTLVCVAGTFFVATVLVYIGMLGQVQIDGRDQGWSLKPWAAGRVGCSLVLFALAGANVVSRDARAKQQFVRGVIACVPLALATGAGLVVWSKRAVPPVVDPAATTPVSATPSGGIPGWMSACLLGLFGVVGGVSVCAAGHFFIRSFEIGADVAEGREPSGVAKA